MQPSRRPTDGRYGGENPNRTQHYYQYQVILKPSPDDVQEVYLASLEALGIDLLRHDVRFVEDDWESPTVGAWGAWAGKSGSMAWRSPNSPIFSRWAASMFVRWRPKSPMGVERLAMFIQGVDSMFDLQWVGGHYLWRCFSPDGSAVF